MTDIHRIQEWSIYLCENCYHSYPQKDKYVAVTCKHKQTILGFFINSRINPFIEKRPDLFVAQASINSSEHRCLDYDSFIDCSVVYKFYAWDLNTSKGVLSPQAKQNILKAVDKATTIEDRYKQMILKS